LVRALLAARPGLGLPPGAREQVLQPARAPLVLQRVEALALSELADLSRLRARRRAALVLAHWPLGRSALER
jgi:hypothetical protein